jgi:hypothetical protein
MKWPKTEGLAVPYADVAPQLPIGLRVSVRKVASKRERVCASCEHQVVTSFEERCELRPEWGCLGKARHSQKLECPEGLWPNA